MQRPRGLTCVCVCGGGEQLKMRRLSQHNPRTVDVRPFLIIKPASCRSSGGLLPSFSSLASSTKYMGCADAPCVQKTAPPPTGQQAHASSTHNSIRQRHKGSQQEVSPLRGATTAIGHAYAPGSPPPTPSGAFRLTLAVRCLRKAKRQPRHNSLNSRPVSGGTSCSHPRAEESIWFTESITGARSSPCHAHEAQG